MAKKKKKTNLAAKVNHERNHENGMAVSRVTEVGLDTAAKANRVMEVARNEIVSRGTVVNRNIQVNLRLHDDEANPAIVVDQKVVTLATEADRVIVITSGHDNHRTPVVVTENAESDR